MIWEEVRQSEKLLRGAEERKEIPKKKADRMLPKEPRKSKKHKKKLSVLCLICILSGENFEFERLSCVL